MYTRAPEVQEPSQISAYHREGEERQVEVKGFPEDHSLCGLLPTQAQHHCQGISIPAPSKQFTATASPAL